MPSQALSCWDFWPPNIFESGSIGAFGVLPARIRFIPDGIAIIVFRDDIDFSISDCSPGISWPLPEPRVAVAVAELDARSGVLDAAEAPPPAEAEVAQVSPPVVQAVAAARPGAFPA